MKKKSIAILLVMSFAIFPLISATEIDASFFHQILVKLDSLISIQGDSLDQLKIISESEECEFEKFNQIMEFDRFQNTGTPKSPWNLTRTIQIPLNKDYGEIKVTGGIIRNTCINNPSDCKLYINEIECPFNYTYSDFGNSYIPSSCFPYFNEGLNDITIAGPAYSNAEIYEIGLNMKIKPVNC